MPDSYISGTQDDILLIADKMAELGGQFAQLAQMVSANPDLYLVYVYDTQIGISGRVTNANVTKEPILSGMSMDMVLQNLDAIYQSISASIWEQSDCVKADFDCRVIKIEMNVQGVDMDLVQYLMLKPGTLYALTLGTGAEEFDLRLPEFEKSFTSLVIE